MKILIVKLGAIGDVLRTTSVLPGLKEKYPPDKIDWITAPKAREILVNNSFIDHLFVWEERENLDGYGLVIGLEDDYAAGELVSRLGSEKIIGAYVKDGQPTYTPSSWFDMSLISKYGIEQANALKRSNRKTFQQHMAELLDVRVAHYVFQLTGDEVEYGSKVVRDLGITKGECVIGINTGAGKRWPLKSWGTAQTIELINRLKKELGVVALILGGEEERERNAIIAKETGMPEAGVHSLRHFAAIINQCGTIFSSDSLAMHFAIALRKQVVVFFGPTPAAEIELYGRGEKIFPRMDCLACYKKACAIQPGCMDLLSVQSVFDAVKRNR